MVPFLMDDDPILFTAASALKMKLFKVEDQLLAIDEDGERTLFVKADGDVVFSLIHDDETLQEKCSRMLICNVLSELKERMQHPETFDYDPEQMQVIMKTRRFLSAVERYFN